jgi:hypothetical protein
MQLYYLAFFKNQGFDVPKISAYLQARDLINRVKPEIVEDKIFQLYNVYTINSNVLKQKLDNEECTIYKYTIDNVIYNFVHSKENNDNTTEIKHEII